MGGPDIPTMPFAASLEHAYMPDEDSVFARMKELADF
jgi:hypothetical protein